MTTSECPALCTHSECENTFHVSGTMGTFVTSRIFENGANFRKFSLPSNFFLIITSIGNVNESYRWRIAAIRSLTARIEKLRVLDRVPQSANLPAKSFSAHNYLPETKIILSESGKFYFGSKRASTPSNEIQILAPFPVRAVDAVHVRQMLAKVLARCSPARISQKFPIVNISAIGLTFF